MSDDTSSSESSASSSKRTTSLTALPPEIHNEILFHLLAASEAWFLRHAPLDIIPYLNGCPRALACWKANSEALLRRIAARKLLHAERALKASRRECVRAALIYVLSGTPRTKLQIPEWLAERKLYKSRLALLDHIESVKKSVRLAAPRVAL